MSETQIISLALDLDRVGLVWVPEIGDEVAERSELERVSILVDPQGLTPRELREFFIWLPTVEQMVQQFEARQAVIYHAGVTSSFNYETVVKTQFGVIESEGASLRVAFGRALQQLLSTAVSDHLH